MEFYREREGKKLIPFWSTFGPVYIIRTVWENKHIVNRVLFPNSLQNRTIKWQSHKRKTCFFKKKKIYPQCPADFSCSNLNTMKWFSNLLRTKHELNTQTPLFRHFSLVIKNVIDRKKDDGRWKNAKIWRSHGGNNPNWSKIFFWHIPRNTYIHCLFPNEVQNHFSRLHLTCDIYEDMLSKATKSLVLCTKIIINLQ